MESNVAPTNFKNLTQAFQDNTNTTTLNVALGLPGLFSTYSDAETRNLQIITIASSSTSILAGLIGMFYLFNIDRRRKVFRHSLILLLLAFDTLKAIIFLIYPVATFIHKHVYGIPRFYNTLGWFTAFSIEGVDLIIGIFAIHFALLIFKPNWKWRNKRTGNLEGGLYKIRYFIIPTLFMFPVLMASLAFIDFDVRPKLSSNINIVLDNNDISIRSKTRIGGYKPWGSWCYLSPTPIWYRLVLSWGPRYFLILSIFLIYISIYVYVRRESARIKAHLREYMDTEMIAEDLHPVPTHGKIYIPKSWLKLSLLRPFLFVIKIVKGFFSLSIFPYEETSTESQSDEPHGRSSGERADAKEHLPLADVEDDSDIPEGGLQILRYKSNNNKHRPSRRGTSRRHSSVDASSYQYNSNTSLSSSKNETIPPLPKISPAKLSDINELLTSDHLSTNNKSSSIIPQVSSMDSIVLLGSNISTNTSQRPATQDGTSNQKTTELLHHLDNVEFDENLAGQNISNELSDVKRDFQRQTYSDMKRRRNQIERNLKSIFIYPFSYVLIWVFPLVIDVSQYSYEIKNGPIVWLAYIDSFIRPASCFINMLVSMYRERPWRYSWEVIQSNELLEKYMIKGNIGEDDIQTLCNSDLGRKGWYFRGKSRKSECWKYSAALWRRSFWYIYRVIRGILHAHITFEDNCYDSFYWEQYYKGLNPVSSMEGHNEDTANVMYQIDDYEAASQKSEIVKVPIYWRIIHMIPMLNGVDLDDLDRRLRLKYNNDEFIIPGLQFALNDNISSVSPVTTFSSDEKYRNLEHKMKLAPSKGQFHPSSQMSNNKRTKPDRKSVV